MSKMSNCLIFISISSSIERCCFAFSLLASFPLRTSSPSVQYSNSWSDMIVKNQKCEYLEVIKMRNTSLLGFRVDDKCKSFEIIMVTCISFEKKTCSAIVSSILRLIPRSTVNRGITVLKMSITVTKIKQERINQDKIKIGPFFDFFLHFCNSFT